MDEVHWTKLFDEDSQESLTKLQQLSPWMIDHIHIRISFQCKNCTPAPDHSIHCFNDYDLIKQHLENSHGLTDQPKVTRKRGRPRKLKHPYDPAINNKHHDKYNEEKSPPITRRRTRQTEIDVDDKNKTNARKIGSNSSVTVKEESSATASQKASDLPNQISIKQEVTDDTDDTENTDANLQLETLTRHLLSIVKSDTLPEVDIESENERSFSDTGDIMLFQDGPDESKKKSTPTLNRARTCPKCDIVLDSIEDCFKHYKKLHDSSHKLADIDPMKHLEEVVDSKVTCCLLCTKQVRTTCFMRHIVLYHIWRPYLKSLNRKRLRLCQICGKTFNSDQTYSRHMRGVHMGVKYKSSKHKPKQYSCQQCSYLTCEPRRLTAHVNYVHSGVKTYACQHCSYSTWERTSLRDHMFRHQNEKRFSCQKCSYQCIQKKQLRSHLLSKHGEVLPKTGTTRNPAPSGPRLHVKRSVELTNRASSTDPQMCPKSKRTRSSKTSSRTQRKVSKVHSEGSLDKANIVTVTPLAAEEIQANVHDVVQHVQVQDTSTAFLGEGLGAEVIASSGLPQPMNEATCSSIFIEPPTQGSATFHISDGKVIRQTMFPDSSGLVMDNTEVTTLNTDPNTSTTSLDSQRQVVLPVDNNLTLFTPETVLLPTQELQSANLGLSSQNSGHDCTVQVQGLAEQPTQNAIQIQGLPQEQHTFTQVHLSPDKRLAFIPTNVSLASVPQLSQMFSGMKTQTSLGQAIPVTPIYAQPSQGGSTLVPSSVERRHNQQTLVYYLK